MRITATAGLFVCVLSILTLSPKADAQSLDIDIKKETIASVQSAFPIEIFKPQEKVEAPTATEEKVVKLYIIKESETLESIAKLNETTWKRIYDKNLQLSNPDLITPGTEITIPEESENMAERPLPEPAQQVVATNDDVAVRPTKKPVQQPTRSSGDSNGNRYTYGYCTWYVKNQRPDLPNNLGNADTWTSRAAAQGLATGSVPRVGAVAQSGMHVAYVTSVNGDGTVTVSEMNYVGWNKVSSRTAPSSSFHYIY